MRAAASLLVSLVIECFLFSPEVHYQNIFTVIEGFRTPAAIKDLERNVNNFHLYIVGKAYPKIAARILNGGNTWKKHPIETLAAYDLSKLHIPADKKLTVKRLDLFDWLTKKQKIVAEHSTLLKGGTSFKITSDTIVRWVGALTETFTALKDALVEDKVCKGKLGRSEIIEVTTLLAAFHGLLEIGLVEFLLEDEALAAAMSEKKTDYYHRKFLGLCSLFSFLSAA